ERCEACEQQREELSRFVTVSLDADCIELIGKVAEICERLKLSTVAPATLGEELQDRRNFIRNASSISSVLEPLVNRRPESSSWYLGDIAKAHALLKETGRDAVLSRNAWTSEPDAPHFLQQLCDKGKQLQTQKAQLASGGNVRIAVELGLSPPKCDECFKRVHRFLLVIFYGARDRSIQAFRLVVSPRENSEHARDANGREALRKLFYRQLEFEGNLV